MRSSSVRISAILPVLLFAASHSTFSQTVAPVEHHLAKAATSGRKVLNALDTRGVSFRGALIYDWSKSIAKDESRAGFGRYSFDIGTAIDGKKLWGVGGNSALLRLRNHLNNFGDDYVGAAQLYSNIDASGRTTLYEVWIEQRLFSDRLRFKGGKIDANTEFDAVQTAGDFLNSSMGYSPTMVAFPSYPEPKLGLNAFLRSSVHNTLGIGIFKTSASGPLIILEPSRTWTVGRAENQGRISVGYWRLSGDIDRFDGSQSRGTQGFSSVTEQTLWRSSRADRAERTVSAFFQVGTASGEVSPFERHLGGGAVLQGTWNNRPHDVIGIAATQVRLSSQATAGLRAGDELVIESYYKVLLNKHFSLVPDFQLMHHPGGSPLASDCPVFTSRFVASF